LFSSRPEAITFGGGGDSYYEYRLKTYVLNNNSGEQDKALCQKCISIDNLSPVHSLMSITPSIDTSAIDSMRAHLLSIPAGTNNTVIAELDDNGNPLYQFDELVCVDDVISSIATVPASMSNDPFSTRLPIGMLRGGYAGSRVTALESPR